VNTNPTACLIIIGNEILSGRTQDKNLAYLATFLNEQGIALSEVRVIPDVEKRIVDTVNECRAMFDYVFTTGGIGPTHDDITTVCVAKAFGVDVIRHPEAERRLLAHYKPEEVNAARMKMADIPVGASLIDNPVSTAPGFVLGNVHVMAGVPRIMQAMLDFLRPQLKGGKPTLSRTLEINQAEGKMAAGVTVVQQRFPEVEIGIYPMIKDGKLACSVVLRSTDEAALNDCYDAMMELVKESGAELLATGN